MTLLGLSCLVGHTWEGLLIIFFTRQLTILLLVLQKLVLGKKVFGSDALQSVTGLFLWATISQNNNTETYC